MRIVLGLVLAALSLNAERYSEEKRDAVHRTLSRNATLEVDVINGSVTVIGDSGSNVRIDGERIIRALNRSEIARAENEVKLDLTDNNGVSRIYEDGPFRGRHEHSDRHYNVSYNLTVHAPSAVALRLRDVNGGLKVQNIDGQFEIHDVNGGIEVSDLSGSGSIETVNGGIKVAFSKNPVADTRFKSVNGRINAAFRSGLNADVTVATVNGSAYTDFEATALASQSSVTMRNGSWRPRGGTRKLRVGSGGPLLSFETVNGSVAIARQDR